MARYGNTLAFQATEFPYVTDGNPQYRDLSWVREIHAIECGITHIPDWILNIPQLEELLMWDNHISEVPAKIGNLKNLRTLSLSGNRFTELPEEIWDLPMLESLNVSGFSDKPKLRKLSRGVGGAPALRHFSLAHTDITTLPDSLFDVKSLEKLDLSECLIEVLPPGIENLQALRELDVSYTPITRLPAGLGKIAGLEVVNAKGCQLLEFPYHLGGLKHLRTLEVSPSMERPLAGKGQYMGTDETLRPAVKHVKEAWIEYLASLGPLRQLAMKQAARTAVVPGQGRLPQHLADEREAWARSGAL